MVIWTQFVYLLETVLLTFYNWTGSAGLAIILFTIVARVFILPLTLKSLQSSRKMQELQPQVREIQRKYGKDPQKLNEETMKLYREYKVNPVGGCLPMLFQLPIFLGVYQAVINLTRESIPHHAARPIIEALSNAGVNVGTTLASLDQGRLTGGFLWLPNLGTPDPWYILPVLSVIGQLIVQLMAMPRVQDPQQKAMTQSMLVLPIVFGYIGFTFPSGAVLYWVVGSILSMIQQYVISGWGSLANYLKFLPTTPGLFPPATPSVAVATSGAGTATETAPAVETNQRLSFWDVMKPLTEQSSAVEGEVVDRDETTTEPRRSSQQPNPRRRRPRR